MPGHRKGAKHDNLPRDIQICWANVARSATKHIALLNIAFDANADIICVQEPWVSTGTKTQTHTGFNLYAPVDSWEWDDMEGWELARPKVLIYVRISMDLRVQQRRPVESRDLLWLNVNGYTILNVYRQPDSDQIINYITGLTPPPKCIIGGDFNTHHDFFEPGVNTFGRGGELVDWATSTMMDFIGQAGTPTHRDGHVLDLTFSNIPWAESFVRTDLHCGSDHETQMTIIPGRGDVPIVQEQKVITEADFGKFNGLVEIGISQLGSPWDITSADEANDFAEKLSKVLVAAIDGAGRAPRSQGRAAAWWTKECKTAWNDYIAARHCSDLLTFEKKTFLTTVRNAKRQFWRRIIDDAKDDTALYKVIGWHKLAPRLKAPPLVIGDRVIEDTLEKAEALKDEILSRFSAQDDIAELRLEDYKGITLLPWDQTVSLEEVERCTIGVSSTSPGTDKVTVRLLKACWNRVKDTLLGLFNRCLALDCFPDTWKYAEVAMIPKVGKKDKSSVRSWRPIALLSCVSKGFERIISRRIAWTALTHRILSSQHGGALPKRSAMDLVASFVHDVEIALAKGLQATIVTLDVQGAFDALLINRLLHRMQHQGWPITLLRLVKSFLTGRQVRVRLEDATTVFYDIACGTPQGSPLSPVLYMLYLAELLHQDQKLRFGYADDLLICRASNTLEENVELLAQDVGSIIGYGEENKIFFAPEKLEMIHLSRKRRATAPNLVVNKDLVIVPITTAPKAGQQPALRWLGAWFDRKLTFRRHVSERVAKARRVAQHIRHLAKTKVGPPASSLRKAVTACVLSSALYGSEAWYAGREKPAKYKRDGTPTTVSTKLGGLVKMIQSTITLAARGVLPVWKTSPLPTLMRDSGLPSAEVALEESRANLALRLRTVDRYHPLAGRIKIPVRRGIKRPITRLQRLGGLVPWAPRPELREPHYSPGCREDPTCGIEKAYAAEQFKRWWKALSPEDISVFSDGSEQFKRGLHGVGYGYAIYLGNRKIFDGLGTIHEISHVFDAEAIGAWKGLQRILREGSHAHRRIWMCIDSTSVIWCLRGNASDSSQWAFHRCQDAMISRDIKIKWSPGHMKIEGNEEADALANSAADPQNPKPCNDPLSQQPTICGIRSEARKLKQDAAAAWWASVEPKLSAKYRKWCLNYRVHLPIELGLPRPTLHRLLALRTGHGDFEWYHNKFHHEDAELNCSCGGIKTPEHLVHCPRVVRYLAKWPFKPRRPPRTQKEGEGYLMRLLQQPREFQKFLEITGFYRSICA